MTADTDLTPVVKECSVCHKGFHARHYDERTLCLSCERIAAAMLKAIRETEVAELRRR